jgi:low affinity Fe/Cu permease
VIVLVWLLCGPIFGFSDTWQLLINTATTILTNLLVFVVQNTQNRNAAALHLKLDEIIRALPQANTRMAIADLENATDEEIARYKQQFEKLARREGEAEANAS